MSLAKMPTIKSETPAKRTVERSRVIITVIPILLVNAVAVYGQITFLNAHLKWGIIGSVVFAGALESIAVYLAYHAHLALLANDSALRLKLGSYAFGFGIGVMNFSHYANNWYPTFAAIAIGLMSASSPWLWGIHSRRASRDILKKQGIIESRALRLGFTRWLWHPLRSFRVMYSATWTGEQIPAIAVAEWELQITERKIEREKRKSEITPRVKKRTVTRTTDTPSNGDAVKNSEQGVNPFTPVDAERKNGNYVIALENARSKSEAIRIMDAEMTRKSNVRPTATDITHALENHGWNVSTVLVRNVRSQDEKRAVIERRNLIAIAEGQESS